ncbi:MAG: peptide deformylase [Bacteroidales bacterium]|nr:peptide deformylase [Bacteroidales bacterium]
MNYKALTAIMASVVIAASCHRTSEGFTPEELSLINGADSIMRVLTIEDSLDNAVLRSISTDMSAEALLAPEYERLSCLMVATVTHPSQDGVGIAGPQVGLNRRIVAVQRFDKAGEPFEVYPNIRIVWTSDSTASGPEGCLSVPGRRGDVLRSQQIVIEYTDLSALGELTATRSPRQIRHHFSRNPLPTVRDTINGFTAVIFQHECDHLDGVLYIDRL